MSEAQEALPRLLIVDDSRMVRASIIKQVRDHFDCREEVDGQSAWETLVVDSAIEVVITDLGMPRLDGLGLLERMRSSSVARLQKLPVVVISGEDDTASRARAREAGASDFITKGVGTAELLARLESLCALCETSRELAASREAHASQSPIDPSSGLATRSYLNWRGSQDLALSRRMHGVFSAMMVGIDDFDGMVETRGADLANLIARRLSAILSSKVRHEDTVSDLGGGRFAVLAPLSDLVAVSAFALRLQSSIDKLVLTYRNERLGIGVSVGVASSSVDGARSLDEMLDLAAGRLATAQAAGGRRVMGNQGQVTRELVERLLRNVVSIDQLLGRLRLGDDVDLSGRVPDIVAALLPLLSRLDGMHGLGFPLDRLQALALRRDKDDAADGE